MLSVKVLGPGCRNCEDVEKVARAAVAKLGLEATVEKVTTFPEMQKYRILATPGLVVNEKLVCSGRVPKEAEVTTWIASAATGEAP
jgi:small redox-active disulfide protein 2